jgi:hypothetical protein
MPLIIDLHRRGANLNLTNRHSTCALVDLVRAFDSELLLHLMLSEPDLMPFNLLESSYGGKSIVRCIAQVVEINHDRAFWNIRYCARAKLCQAIVRRVVEWQKEHRRLEAAREKVPDTRSPIAIESDVTAAFALASSSSASVNQSSSCDSTAAAALVDLRRWLDQLASASDVLLSARLVDRLRLVGGMYDAAHPDRVAATEQAVSALISAIETKFGWIDLAEAHVDSKYATLLGHILSLPTSELNRLAPYADRLLRCIQAMSPVRALTHAHDSTTIDLLLEQHVPQSADDLVMRLLDALLSHVVSGRLMSTHHSRLRFMSPTPTLTAHINSRGSCLVDPQRGCRSSRSARSSRPLFYELSSPHSRSMASQRINPTDMASTRTSSGRASKRSHSIVCKRTSSMNDIRIGCGRLPGAITRSCSPPMHCHTTSTAPV